MAREEVKYYHPCSTCRNNECVWKGTKDTHLICENYKSPDGDCISKEKTLEKFCDYVGSGMSMNDFDALYDIVAKTPSVQPKADVLDKIRAEIEQLTIVEGGDDYVRKMAELFSLKMKVLQIIDKYRQEDE